ncbi:Fur-regulated basic protein FbpA [Shouchella miscanthi]|uniref:Fur-regulated basic protein FbpA n=1 Tax=Shouchella miscanthi TaxID=2598861 RepID=UPI0011A0C3AE|nr:Fur-regulated basic protein FbpA [Shouchella miscanthi]
MTEEELIKKRQEKMIDKLLKAGIYKYKDTHLYELRYAEVEDAYLRFMVEKEK